MYDEVDDNYIHDLEVEATDLDRDHMERDALDEELNGDYETEARNSYTDALARVIADTLALAAKQEKGREEATIQNINTFLQGLEDQGFCYAGEVLQRSTYILIQD